MVDYIQHSSCVTFTIHSTCTSTGQAFKFTHNGSTESTMYGGTDSGDDLKIQANDADTYPYLYMAGDGDISLYSSNDIYFYDDATEEFKFYDNSIDIKGDRAIYINDDETYIGHGAGDNITSGEKNTLLGNDALFSNTSGNSNTALGYYAGRSAATDIYNCVYVGAYAGENNTQQRATAIGYEALQNLTSTTNFPNIGIGYQAGKGAAGSHNIWIGNGAGESCTGNDNTFIGAGSGEVCTGSNNAGINGLTNVTSGAENVCIGRASLDGITTGDNNVAVGREAQSNNNTTGVVAVGYRAGKNNTQDDIVAIGYEALENNTGSNNVAVGYQALTANTEGYWNTAVGNDSLAAMITGDHNVAVGYDSLAANTEGRFNTVLGTQAGSTGTSFYSCVILGWRAGQDNNTNNRLYINNSDSAYPLIYGEFDNDVVKFGNNNDRFFFKVDGNDGDNTYIYGGDTASADLVLYCNQSDTYPLISMAGAADIYLQVDTGDSIFMYQGGNAFFEFFESGTDDRIDGKTSNNDIYLNPSGSGVVKIDSNAIKIGGDDRGIYINDDETYIGHGAGDGITSGENNTLLGYNAGNNITEGNSNIAIGYYPLYENTTGTGNVAIGQRALDDNTINDYNTGVGFEAGRTADNTESSYFGHRAGKNSSGDYVTLIGAYAGENNTEDGIVAIGYEALKNNQGTNNVAVGYQSLLDATTGYGNIGLGNISLQNVTTGEYNIGIGNNAGGGIIGGDKNIAIGAGALVALTEGHYNTALGYKAGNNCATDIDSCILIGHEAGKNNTQNNIVAIGYEALEENTAVLNTAIGYKALTANTTGVNNTCVGNIAGEDNISGSYNSAFGYNALSTCTSGDANTAIGESALQFLTTQSKNVAVGNASLGELTSGDENTAVGVFAGRNTAAHSGCVFIGYEAGKGKAGNNKLYINNSDSAYPLIYGEFDNDVVKFGDNSAHWNFIFSRTSDDSWIYGGEEETSSCGMKPNTHANSNETFIKVHENGNVYIGAEAGGDINFYEGNANFMRFSESGTDDRIEGMTTNNDIYINPNGSGVVKFGTYSSLSGESVTGYITIKDAGGTTRKLAVVA